MVQLNLIPESVLAGFRQRQHIRRWLLSLVIAATLVAVPATTHWFDHRRVEELQALKDKLQNDLRAARADLKTATTQAQEAFLRLERAKALRTKRAWSDLLAFIGACLPQDCFLTAIATDPPVPAAAPAIRPFDNRRGQPTMAPSTPPGGAAADAALDETPVVVTIEAPRKLRLSGEAAEATSPLVLVAKLKEARVFQDVILERSLRDKPEEDARFRFELVCEW